MSLFDRMGHRRNAIIGAAVVGVSLVWAVAPASAAAASRTTLSTSTPSIGFGTIAKLKAVVKPTSGTLLPTGSVTFREGTTATSPAVGPAVTLATVNSVQTAKIDLPSLAIGTHTFIATYSGSTAFNASTSLTTTIVVSAVAKVGTTTTASTSTPNVAPGAEVKLKAVVKPVSGTVKPTGTVTFSEGATTLAAAVPLVLIGTVETAKATLPSLPTGTHVITATYSGSQGFNASTSPATPAVTVTVGKINTTCTLTAKPSANDPLKTVMAITVKGTSGTVIPTGGGLFSIDVGRADAQAPQAYALLATGRAQITYYFPAPAAVHTVRATYDGDTAFNACTSAIVSFTAP